MLESYWARWRLMVMRARLVSWETVQRGGGQNPRLGSFLVASCSGFDSSSHEAISGKAARHGESGDAKRWRCDGERADWCKMRRI